MAEEIPQPAAEKPPAKSPRRKASMAQEVRNSDLQSTGRILPNCPTTAEDLVSQWSIPASEVYGVRVNVMKQDPGDLQPKLMTTVPVLEYDMAEIAKDFGPGLYFLKGNPHRWATHSAKFEVSESYARRAGFGRLPEVRATEALAARTLKQATTGPTDPLELMAAVEALLDRKLAERGPAPVATVQSAGPADALMLMEKQAEGMMSFMGVMDRMESRMMAIAERRAGLRSTDEPIPEGSSTLELIKAVLPYVAPVLANLAGGLGSRMAGGPSADRSRPAQPVGMTQPTQPAAVPAQPTAAQVQEVQAMSAEVPALTSDEQTAIAPSVRMLKPYASALAEVAKDTTKTDAQLAEDLAGYIGPQAWGWMLNLAELVRVKGPGVLGYIGPELLESPRWPNIIAELAAMIREWMQEDTNHD